MVDMGTATAPILMVARKLATNSGQSNNRIATLASGVTPSCPPSRFPSLFTWRDSCL